MNGCDDDDAFERLMRWLVLDELFLIPFFILQSVWVFFTSPLDGDDDSEFWKKSFNKFLGLDIKTLVEMIFFFLGAPGHIRLTWLESLEGVDCIEFENDRDGESSRG